MKSRYAHILLIGAWLVVGGCNGSSGSEPDAGGDADGGVDADPDSDGGAETETDALCEPDLPGDTTLLDAHTVIAFVDANVIAMNDDAVLEHATVVVENGVITDVGPSASTMVPDEALVVCATDRYLMPGLTDMHVHFNYPEDRLLYVASGVTTIRNMWGWEWHLDYRDQFENKELLGPRLVTTGPIMDGDPPYWPGSLSVTTAEEAREAVTSQAELGYDAIKVYNLLPIEAYEGIIAEAAERDLPVVGHVPDAVGLKAAIAAGQESIEHYTGYDPLLDDGTQERLTVESGVWNCATLVVMDNYERLEEIQANEPAELIYVNPTMVEMWRESTPYLFGYEAYEDLLHRDGANLLIGTDVSNPYVIPGVSLHDELALSVHAGMTPYEVLHADTVGSARYLNEPDETGTVEVGKRADLLLLSANPLDDIENTRHIAGVMVNGSWYQQARLQEQLDELAEYYAGFGL